MTDWSIWKNKLYWLQLPEKRYYKNVLSTIIILAIKKSCFITTEVKVCWNVSTYIMCVYTTISFFFIKNKLFSNHFQGILFLIPLSISSKQMLQECHRELGWYLWFSSKWGWYSWIYRTCWQCKVCTSCLLLHCISYNFGWIFGSRWLTWWIFIFKKKRYIFI